MKEKYDKKVDLGLDGTDSFVRFVEEDLDFYAKQTLRISEAGRTFTETVSFYGLERSEGLLLRYLSDTYRALRQTVPEQVKTDELDDIVDWLGETVRQTDSSLIDEWEALTDPQSVAKAAAAMAAGEVLPPPRPITANERTFRVMVRNAMFQKVQLAARDHFARIHFSVGAHCCPPRTVRRSIRLS